MKCCKQILVRGLAFARYRQCSREGIIKTSEGMVCKQHSPESKVKLDKKKEEAGVRKMNIYYARLFAKSGLPKT